VSVIHDALKTAQREKQSRETGSPAGGAPLIGATRGRAEEPFNWKNAATIALSSIVIVAALGSLWVRMRGPDPRPAENIPVVTMPADISPAEPQATTPRYQPSAQPQVAVVDPPRSSAASSSSSEPAPGVQRPAPVVGSTAARPVAPADVPARAAVEQEPVSSAGSRLRIAVEQPREGDIARLFAAGVAAHRAGDLATARAAYERVLAAVPSDVDVLNNLGVVLSAVREFDRAESLLRRAVGLSPDHAGAWNNLGTVLAQRGQPADAIAAFQHALALDPQHQGARVSLAQQHLAIGAPARARELLEEVIAVNPSMAEALYTLGQACEMEKDWAGAVRAYGAFVRVAPPRLSGIVERVQQRVQMLSARAQ